MPALLWAFAAVLLIGAAYLGWSYSSKTGLFAPTGFQNIDLLAADENDDEQIFMAYSDQSLNAESLLALSRAHCDDQARRVDVLEICYIFIRRSDEPLEQPATQDLHDVYGWAISTWRDSDRIAGIYVLETHRGRRAPPRRDDILALDCAVFPDLVQSEEIVCKGSDADPLVHERREESGQTSIDAAEAAAEAAFQAELHANTAAAAAAMAADDTANDQYFYVSGLDPNGDNWVALKREPDIRSERIAKLGPDTLFVSTGNQVGDWLEITTVGGLYGWISIDYVACCR